MRLFVACVLLALVHPSSADFIDGILDDSGETATKTEPDAGLAEKMKKESMQETQLISMLAFNGLSCDGCDVFQMKETLSAYASRRRYWESWSVC
jgi:hypothetical protein